MHDKPYATELRILAGAVRQAGARALDLARSGFDVQTKKDRSPVTTADLEVNRILHEMQQTTFPEDGWLSEESPDDPSRLQKSRLWIVDPIDGTKAFVNRVPEFCVSIALVEAGKPVVAAIYNPSTDELFTAVRGQGLQLNGKAVAVEPPQHYPPIVMINPWEQRQGRWEELGRSARLRPMYSIAHAMALAAVGRVQATMTAEPENEWDVAAGVLLLEESGGLSTDAAGATFTFNQPTPRFRGVIAVAATADRGLRSSLQSHADRARRP